MGPAILHFLIKRPLFIPDFLFQKTSSLFDNNWVRAKTILYNLCILLLYSTTAIPEIGTNQVSDNMDCKHNMDGYLNLDVI